MSRFVAGTCWHYGLNTDICGALVEAISGVPFAEFLSARASRDRSEELTIGRIVYCTLHGHCVESCRVYWAGLYDPPLRT